MNKLFLALFYAICGLLLGLCLNLIIVANQWLEMRMYERIVMEACVSFGIVFSLFKNSASVSLFYILQSSMFLICFWISKMSLIYYIIRNVHLEILSISIIKLIFLGLLTFINILIIYHFASKKLSFFNSFH